MKKRLKIDLFSKGQENENLATIIAENNAGKNPVGLEDIASYLWVRRSIFESYTKEYSDVYGKFEDDDKTRLYIMQKGECVAVIEEIEVSELQPKEEKEEVL